MKKIWEGIRRFVADRWPFALGVLTAAVTFFLLEGWLPR